MKWQSIALVSLLFSLAGCLDGSPEPLPPEMQEKSSPQTANVERETTTKTPEQPEATSTPETTASSEAQEETTAPAPVPVDKPQVTRRPKPSVTATKPRSVARPQKRRSEEDEQWATPEDLGISREKAGVGMGKKGKGYGRDVVTYPLASYFRMREKISLQQIKKAMQLYETMNGHYPRTQEEFRKEIIKANAIKMAVLPQDKKYFYNPDKGELLVIKVAVK